MLLYEDVSFQLVDLPPVTAEHPVPWMANALQPATGALLIVDLADPGCVDQVLRLLEILRGRRVYLLPSWPRGLSPDLHDEADPFATHLPTALVAAKADLIADLPGELATFGDLTGLAFPVLRASTVTGEGLAAFGSWLFAELGVIRVYTKVPHRPADLSRPYTLRRGQMVQDVAFMVHKEVAGGLKHARLWSRTGAEGVQVGRDHRLEDGDILELHV
jgi:hypothetical protein